MSSVSRWHLAAERAELEESTLSPLVNHRGFTPLVKKWLHQQWQQSWQTEEGGRHAFSIFPRVALVPWYRRLHMSRRHIVSINRAATNHNWADAHLARFGIAEMNQRSCGEDYASVDHLIWRSWNDEHSPLDDAIDSDILNSPIRDLIGLQRWEDLKKMK